MIQNSKSLFMKPVAVITMMAFFACVHQPLVYSQESSASDEAPAPRVISFDPGSDQYQSLLDGEKDSVIFHSGVVTLLPGEAGELHSTENYEEMIIALEGNGEIRINGGKILNVSFGKVAFIPPRTEHQPVNTGAHRFRYIYVASELH
jgi:mannose-6-phosphate isomerase-like protein (cupin superfamily)